MPWNRREFIKAISCCSALVSAGGLPLAGLAATAATIRLSPGQSRSTYTLAGAEVATTVWTFNGQLPGPELRFKKGDRVRIEVTNRLPHSTTIHWHGLRIPHAMDGVPLVSQPPIKPGESFIYEYEVKDSGTFWYHPHDRSFEQVGRGLHGPLIVEETDPIEVDRDIVWTLADFKLSPDGQHAPFGALSLHSREGRLGNVITLNGQQAGAGNTLAAAPGERLRLRLINAATARLFLLKFTGHTPWVIALDGNGIPPHQPDNGRIFLAPGMRVDLVLDLRPDGSGSFVVQDEVSNSILTKIAYRDQTPVRTVALGKPKQLAPNDIPVPDLKQLQFHDIEFGGGEIGPPTIASVNGKEITYQDMKMKHGLAWTLAGYAVQEDAHHHEPLLTLRQGGHYAIRMYNKTEFVHPMHLHGHTFKVLSYNGVAPPFDEWRDTVFLAPLDEVVIAFVADNPGDWMFHCHILEHAASGMMGIIRVA
jgi:FtsP/CotA-like multicopper oxidase with cupredoxin domain